MPKIPIKQIFIWAELAFRTGCGILIANPVHLIYKCLFTLNSAALPCGTMDSPLTKTGTDMLIKRHKIHEMRK